MCPFLNHIDRLHLPPTITIGGGGWGTLRRADEGEEGEGKHLKGTRFICVSKYFVFYLFCIIFRSGFSLKSPKHIHLLYSFTINRVLCFFFIKIIERIYLNVFFFFNQCGLKFFPVNYASFFSHMLFNSL